MFDFLFKKRYGLALGAGSSKGIAHIGVIKALNDLNIEITHIGGTSAGSIVGGIYALTGDIRIVEEILNTYESDDFVKILGKDIGINKGIFKGNSLLGELEKHIGNAMIEDCKIPFVAVSTNMRDGKRVYHTTGLLKDAIRASCSMPFIFKPYELDGKILVDGGLSENIPVKAVKSIGAKKVIGVRLNGYDYDEDKLDITHLTNHVLLTTFYNYTIHDLEGAKKSIIFENLDKYSNSERLEKKDEIISFAYDKTIAVFK